MSIACSLIGGDECLLLDDSDVMSFDFRPSLASSYIGDSKQSKQKDKFEDDIKMVDNPFKDKLLGIFYDYYAWRKGSEVRARVSSTIKFGANLRAL